jgi:AcrR family transcriptional regulator
MTSSTLAQLAAALLKSAEPTDATTDKILDAALDDLRRSPHISLGDVAKRAGVGRVTIYRRFGDKEGLLRALIVRECHRLTAEVESAMARGRNVEQRFCLGFVAMLRGTRQRAFVGELIRAQPEGTLQLLTIDGQAILRLGIAFIAQQIRAEQNAGHLPQYDPEPVAEILARLAHSYALTPKGGKALADDKQAVELARLYLVPLLMNGPAKGRPH